MNKKERNYNHYNTTTAAVTVSIQQIVVNGGGVRGMVAIYSIVRR